MTTAAPRTRVRHEIVLFLFVVTTINYADRATLSIVGPDMSKALGLDPIAYGYVLSAFGWSYAAAQIPGGWLLDRFGSKRIYGLSIAVWSVFTMLSGFVGVFEPAVALVMLFVLRLLLGIAEAPSFPGNSRIVASWFPTAERGTASAIFNSAQYFSTVLFTPLMGWIAHHLGWAPVFWVMGGLGLLLAGAWPRLIHAPRAHPRVNAAELEHIAQGGGVVDLDNAPRANDSSVQLSAMVQLLRIRMLLGVYVAQYGINTLTWFFLTWFPTYLVNQRGMSMLKVGFVATLPALCGFIGGVLGGFISDSLLRRGCSLTLARKAPIVAGLLLSTVIVVCNYVESHAAVILCMSLAFFGKGIGALGWAVVSDTAPRGNVGLSGGLFNTFGNIAAITTPIVIGYIVGKTGSFNGALVFVGAHAVLAVVCYLFVVGPIRRVELAAS